MRRLAALLSILSLASPAAAQRLPAPRLGIAVTSGFPMSEVIPTVGAGGSGFVTLAQGATGGLLALRLGGMATWFDVSPAVCVFQPCDTRQVHRLVSAGPELLAGGWRGDRLLAYTVAGVGGYEATWRGDVIDAAGVAQPVGRGPRGLTASVGSGIVTTFGPLHLRTEMRFHWLHHVKSRSARFWSIEVGPVR